MFNLDVEAFAAQRTQEQDDAIESLSSIAEDWLGSRSQADLDRLMLAVGGLWSRTYTDLTGSRAPAGTRGVFLDEILASLKHTTDSTDPVDPAQTNRVAMWLAVAATNGATKAALRQESTLRMRWVSMRDDDVRTTHRVADGQVRPAGQTFEVGQAELRYPGDPLGPLDEIMGCRCILAPAAGGSATVNGEAYIPLTTSGTNTYAQGGFTSITPTIRIAEPFDADAVANKILTALRGEFVMAPPEPEVEDEVDDELADADIEGEDLVDDVPPEIPVHGILAPEGVPTGDGRQFALGALSARELPLPLRYEIVGTHGGSTSDVVTVGRIDEAWRDEGSNAWRFRGAVVMSKQYATEVVEGIMDGTIRGVSIDADDLEVEAPAGQPGSIEEALEMLQPETTVFSKARVAGLTIVPIPAFSEAYIDLGEAFEDELSDDDRAALEACGCTAAGPEDEDTNVELGYDYWRDVSTDERKRLADEGNAMPDGSYPIANVDDLKNAIQSIGRAKDPEAAKKHIKKRARQLGAEDLIPDGWSITIGSLLELQMLVDDGVLPNDDDMYGMVTDLFTAGEKEIDVALSIVAAGGWAAPSQTYAPGTKDGPGWITHPRATARIRRYWTHGKGAAKIRWGMPGDFNRCRSQLAKYVANPSWLAGTCANMHKEALGYWPSTHRKLVRGSVTAGAAPVVRLVASAGYSRVPAEYLKKPELKGPTPLSVDPQSGRVWGHLATWGTCHIGIAKVCTTAPHSATDYSYFHTGAVETDEGNWVPVGHITMDTGHAGDRLNATATVAHYDNTGAVVADIRAGEDAWGIWVAGVMRPDVPEEKARALAAAALSGDWRRIAGNLELVGALAVNVPGFPIPRTSLAASGEEQVSLTAAGIVPQDSAFAVKMDAETVAAITRTAVEEYRSQERRAERLEKIKPMREAARSTRLSLLRARVPKED
jgi:hypothetical protein